MQPKFSSKISKFFVGFFIAAIMISFLFAGFQGFMASPDSVAQVNGRNISTRDYQNILQAETERFAQLFGGKSLTAEQMRQFRIKENVLTQLIQKELLIDFANQLGLAPSSEEIKETIKNLPFFQTAEKFDVGRYRGVLQANGLSPAKFEEMTANDIKFQKITGLIQNVHVSDNFIKDVLKFKNDTANAVAIQFERESLVPFIEIPNADVEAFANNEENLPILQSLYSTLESEYNKPEEVKARHILLRVENDQDATKVLNKIQDIRKKVNAKNFADIAKKETEDPSGQNNGGDLGWFAKGRMVPEFDAVAFTMKKGEISNPIKTTFGYHLIYLEDKKEAIVRTLDQVKNEVAKKHLQKSNRKELEKLAESVEAELQAALAANQITKAEAIAKKYQMDFEKNAKISMIEPNAGQIQFTEENLAPLFETKSTEAVAIKDLPYYKFLKLQSFVTTQEMQKNIDANLVSEKASQTEQLVNTFQLSLLKELEAKSSIVTYPNML